MSGIHSSFLTFSQENYHGICDQLSERDEDLAEVIFKLGYPPFWSRPNTFETLVHIILEQQVSLASALATLNKLKEKIGAINPENFLVLTDEELRACYFSRQKTIYVRGLAKAIGDGIFSLTEMETLPDEEVRSTMLRLKGIGHWTIDVYLMFVLQHADVFPMGGREELLRISDSWKPYRTIATMILWHYYLSVRRAAPPLK
jgi:DNA-3-methyladenine glycosylase II